MGKARKNVSAAAAARQPSPPPEGPAEELVGATMEVLADYLDMEQVPEENGLPHCGYLVLQRGEVLRLLYSGSAATGDEDWLFGEVTHSLRPGERPGRRGWLPRKVRLKRYEGAPGRPGSSSGRASAAPAPSGGSGAPAPAPPAPAAALAAPRAAAAQAAGDRARPPPPPSPADQQSAAGAAPPRPAAARGSAAPPGGAAQGRAKATAVAEAKAKAKAKAKAPAGAAQRALAPASGAARPGAFAPGARRAPLDPEAAPPQATLGEVATWMSSLVSQRRPGEGRQEEAAAAPPRGAPAKPSGGPSPKAPSPDEARAAIARQRAAAAAAAARFAKAGEGKPGRGGGEDRCPICAEAYCAEAGRRCIRRACCGVRLCLRCDGKSVQSGKCFFCREEAGDFPALSLAVA